jgi:hypothetical protein
MSKLVNNEQRKLTATYLNGLGIAIFAVGMVAPFVATGLHPPSDRGHSLLVVVLGLSSMLTSGASHMLARSILKGLVE